MNYSKILGSISIILTALITFSGCTSENTTNPVTKTNINGKVVDPSGTAISGVKVLVGGNTVLTDGSGNFQFTDVTAPYDAVILDTPEVIIVKRLTRADPLLVENKVLEPLASVRVHIQGSVYHDDYMSVLFNDTFGIITGYDEIFSQEDTCTVSLKGHYGQNVRGTVYLSEYGFMNGYWFKRFAKKPANLVIGVIQDLYFALTDFDSIYTSPKAYHNILNPNGYLGVQYKHFLNYGNVNNLDFPGGQINLSGPPYNSMYVPTGITPDPIPSILVSTSDPFTQKLQLLITGVTSDVVIDGVPALISPANGAGNVTVNTPFRFSNPPGYGINCIRVFNSSQGKSFTVYLSEEEVTLPDLTSYGFAFGSGLNYGWNDTWLAGFRDTDELCSANRFSNSNFAEILQSVSWAFTTP